jgi:hypothetical protein
MAGQQVFIAGGANSAGEAAVNLARHARQVTLVMRRDSVAATMSQYLIDESTEPRTATSATIQRSPGPTAMSSWKPWCYGITGAEIPSPCEPHGGDGDEQLAAMVSLLRVRWGRRCGRVEDTNVRRLAF